MPFLSIIDKHCCENIKQLNTIVTNGASFGYNTAKLLPMLQTTGTGTPSIDMEMVIGNDVYFKITGKYYLTGLGNSEDVGFIDNANLCEKINNCFNNNSNVTRSVEVNELNDGINSSFGGLSDAKYTVKAEVIKAINSSFNVQGSNVDIVIEKRFTKLDITNGISTSFLNAPNGLPISGFYKVSIVCNELGQNDLSFIDLLYATLEVSIQCNSSSNITGSFHDVQGTTGFIDYSINTLNGLIDNSFVDIKVDSFDVNITQVSSTNPFSIFTSFVGINCQDHTFKIVSNANTGNPNTTIADSFGNYNSGTNTIYFGGCNILWNYSTTLLGAFTSSTVDISLNTISSSDPNYQNMKSINGFNETII